MVEKKKPVYLPRENTCFHKLSSPAISVTKNFNMNSRSIKIVKIEIKPAITEVTTIKLSKNIKNHSHRMSYPKSKKKQTLTKQVLINYLC